MPNAINPIWRPSTARTLVIDGFVPVPRGSSASAPAPLQWPVKDPEDVLDYQFDITPALLGNDKDTIRTLDVTIAPNRSGDLAVVSAQADGPIAVLWMQGGLSGVTYAVRLSIGTANGRVVVRDVLLPVLSLSSPDAAPSNLLTDNGLPLLDGNGDPLQIF